MAWAIWRSSDVALAGLELGEVALGHLAVPRQDLAGHAAPGAGLADAVAQQAQIGGLAALPGAVPGPFRRRHALLPCLSRSETCTIMLD
jgi:hypothetical protein